MLNQNNADPMLGLTDIPACGNIVRPPDSTEVKYIINVIIRSPPNFINSEPRKTDSGSEIGKQF